ncbi:MAG TPA: glycoside hydrolase family 32 protein [Puia sp.]|nr:glycoside hydrolase family 32 protein [Puia sp.]
MRFTTICVFAVIGILLLAPGIGRGQAGHEQYRPRFHFSPREKWTNDPNGLVYYQGTYHLFFQYYPEDIVWGPMHWGHATSNDLVHWKQQPIALYPDSLGYIFSGSVVVDSANSSGLGRDGKIPLVAIFTHHDPKGEKSGSHTFQNQSLAYSTDGGATWSKYAGNPVLKNPGIIDFRDPSVSWHPAEKKWVMALATKDRISFYSSPDLKDWTKESEFGERVGAHGGVWECPNLFPLSESGRTWWVLLVSNNPGGPNGGSGTQYFIGDWDGNRFTPADTLTRWIDYGPDDYAGITYNNLGSQRIFLGWMSNWDYANKVPTKIWRNAMTIPRELSLRRSGGRPYLASRPTRQLGLLAAKKNSDHSVDGQAGIYRLDAEEIPLHSFAINFSNDKGQELIIGYDQGANQYYIDRSRSGKTDFHPGFGSSYHAPRISTGEKISLTIVMDASSAEVFADDGLTVMTAVFFADTPLGRVNGNAGGKMRITDLSSALP